MKSVRNAVKTVFITGTDTGAGKTLLTAILLHDLRESGVRALAMKPFCSGGLGDVKLLNRVQNQALSQGAINPFYFPEPVAPLVSARKSGQKIAWQSVLGSIKRVKKYCDCLLIEGSGGILVPLGEGYDVRDLVKKLACPVVVAARNRLGVINQVRLTVESMQYVGIKDIMVVLMGIKKCDISTQTNAKIIAELVAPMPVLEVPYLGEKAGELRGIKKGVRKIKKTIALIREFANVSAF
jgi:dethiobiotin synthetase